MKLTYTNINQHLREIEARILTPRECSNCTWMGITIEWEFGSKKTGNFLKRGKSYGSFKYYYDENELTREEAINEILKPSALRQALSDLRDIRTCKLCSFTEIIRDTLKSRWSRIGVKTGERNTIWLDICPDCSMAIYQGSLAKRLFSVDL